MNIKRLAATTAVLLFTTGTAAADIAIRYSNPTGNGDDMVLVVSGKRAAMEIPGGQGQDGRIVFDSDSNKLFMVMDSEQRYMDMDAMMQSLGGLSDMLSGMMEGLPDDAKGQLGGLLGNQGGDQAPAVEPELVATGKTDTVGGIDCSISTYRSASAEMEMCLADPGDVGVSQADFEVLKAMMAKQKESAKQAGEMLGIRGMDMGPGAINQVPLRMRQLSGPDSGTSSEFRGISEEVDVMSVTIPDNYQVMSLTGG